jgi:hypothetical protein
MPDNVQPQQTVSGPIPTHREGGLKFLNAGFVESGEQFDFCDCGWRHSASMDKEFGLAKLAEILESS